MYASLAIHTSFKIKVQPTISKTAGHRFEPCCPCHKLLICFYTFISQNFSPWIDYQLRINFAFLESLGVIVEDKISLVISIISLALSFFLGGWTVYRDAIQKPKFRLTIGPRTIIQKNRDPIGPDFYVQALNLGPLSNRIGLVFGRPSWFQRQFKKKPSAMISPDYTHVGHTARAQVVEIGDTVSFVFPLNGDFLKADFAQIGVSDGYGRMHWASRKVTQRAYAEALAAKNKAETA